MQPMGYNISLQPHICFYNTKKNYIKCLNWDVSLCHESIRLFWILWQQRLTKLRMTSTKCWKRKQETAGGTGQVNWLQISNMTGYKKRILKRQSFSEVKTGRGSPISKINKWKLYKLRNNFRVMVLNVKMWRLRVFHHLQSIKLSRDSEHLEKSGENLCSALKTTSWVQKDFQKSSSVNTVSFTEVKALSCKENVACEDDPEMLLSS